MGLKGQNGRGAGCKRFGGAKRPREEHDQFIGPPRPKAPHGQESWGPLPKKPPKSATKGNLTS